MRFSVIPFLVIGLFGFLVWLVARSRAREAISRPQAGAVLALLGALGIWTGLLVWLGIAGIHEALAASPVLPQLLWQALVPVSIVAFGLAIPGLRAALVRVRDGAPVAGLIAIQALRLGAIGSVAKAASGEIASSYPLWVGIPDFVFGASAVLVLGLHARGLISERGLARWSLLGAAIILVPTFVFLPWWMHEPGFAFIFAFPMVLAPGIVVPLLVLLNGLLAWRALSATSGATVRQPSTTCGTSSTGSA